MTGSRTRTIGLLLLAVIFFNACSPASAPATPAPVSTAAGTPTQSPVPTETSSPTLTPTPAPLAKRVLILSLDGLRADAVAIAPMPNLLALMKSGAYTLNAQTIKPSATLPAHASMLTGLCPAKHGVTWDDYLPAKGYAKGPSLFDLAHAAGLQTDMVVGKKKLIQVTDPASVDSFTYINDRDVVITQKILENFPNDFGVLFIHFPTPDAMGEVYGWPSKQYWDVLRQADGALAELLKALDDKGLRSETLVIVTADHGGHGMGHYTGTPLDMTIPWVVSGPGVVPGELSVPVNTTDTAATAAWALGLPIPSSWDGIPVYEAFGGTSPARPDPRCP
ncbi:MAG TPA: alkaline phosphatase family protein [Anaerolineales bacterium]|nr:alkaline phosphatase family protein [Anaerolineales bacterium]